MDHFYILLLNVKNIKLSYFHIHILIGIIMCNSCNILRTMEFILDILSSPLIVIAYVIFLWNFFV